MERADIILSASKIVTMDDGYSVIDDGAIAVNGARIAAIGPRRDICKRFLPENSINHENGIIIPGLINTHAHIAMTLFRGLADDVELGAFLQRVWDMEGRNISEQSVRLGAKLGIAEMLLSGTTCSADMYWHPFVTAGAAISLGIRLVSGETFIDSPGADGVLDWPARMKRGEAFLEAFSDHESITPALCPHSTFTVSQKHLREIRDLADRHRAGVHIHASEARHEMETVRRGTGKSPIEVLDDCGLLDERTWLAHAVHVDDDEIARLRETGTAVAHCPVSNMKLASGCAPVTRYLDRGVTVGLGTDGSSTGNDLNMWMAMRTAALMHKNASEDPTVLPAREAVWMATRGGAGCLGLDNDLGSLEPGKYADIVVVSCSKPHGVPVYDAYSHLVYAARPDDVETVLVGGRVVVDEGRLTTADTRSMVAELREFAAGMTELTGPGEVQYARL